MPAFFASLAEVDYPRDRLELHLVDNGAGDGSLAAARREIERLAERLPAVVIHEPGANLGFAGRQQPRPARGARARRRLRVSAQPGRHLRAARPARGRAGRRARGGRGLGAVAPGAGQRSRGGQHQRQPHPLPGLRLRRRLPRRARARCRPSRATSPSRRAPACSCPCRCCGRWACSTKPCGSTTRISISAGASAWPACATWWRPPACAGTTTSSRARKSKWYWMERNRWIVVLKNYRLATVLLLLLPAMLLADSGLLAHGGQGGLARREAALARCGSCGPRPGATCGAAGAPSRACAAFPTASYCATSPPSSTIPISAARSVTRLVEPVWKVMLAALRTLVRW